MTKTAAALRKALPKVMELVAYSGTMLLLAGLNLLLAAGFAYVLRQVLLQIQPLGLFVTNYRGTKVAAVGGVVLAGTVFLTLGSDAAGVISGFVQSGARAASGVALSFYSEQTLGLAIVAVGFFLFGTIDDLLTVAGGPRARGFAGHLSAIRRGVVTGGIVKILGGGAVALIAGALWETKPVAALLDAALVALSANLVNLLDLRPGRGVKVFFIWWLPLAIAAWRQPFLPASISVAAAAAVWLPSDLRERGMLGDSGANLLGAIGGAGLALVLPGAGKLVALIFLMLLTLASELVSFSSVIRKTAPLAWFDRLGRVFTENDA
jgi:UDP-GlcNAc:undecaprenyl-phosphate/decaprenyl-phosphate GlcNAc-1-phosphate transferase